MAESWLVVVLLGVVSLSVVAMTAILFVTARDFRRTLQELRAMLPNCDEAVHEARRALGEVRHLLKRTDNAARHVETVVHRACQAASEAIERFVFLKERAQTFLAERFGNGARSGPRRQYRAS